MSSLPVSAQQAGSLLSSSLALSDAAYRQMIIDWGYAQIDKEYPLDPVRAPLNALRRKRAMMDWDRVVRTNGAELRNLVAGQAVAELTFQLDRYRADVLARDEERRRQEAEDFNHRKKAQELTLQAALELRTQETLMRLGHQLSQIAEDAASQRRMNERANEATHEASLLTLQYSLNQAGITTPQQIIQATQLINDEISKIRNDPSLTDDDRHLQIKTLLDALPHMLRSLTTPPSGP